MHYFFYYLFFEAHQLALFVEPPLVDSMCLSQPVTNSDHFLVTSHSGVAVTEGWGVWVFLNNKRRKVQQRPQRHFSMCNICQQPRFPPLVPVLRWHLQWRVEGGTEWSTEDVARHGLGQTQVIILINLCVNMSDQHRPSSTKNNKIK